MTISFQRKEKKCFWVSGREERLLYVLLYVFLSAKYKLNEGFISNYRRTVTGLILAK